MTEIEILRHNELIDPQLHVWGWEVALYLFLGGLTAGLMIIVALAGRRSEHGQSSWMRWLPFAAPVLLSLGMLALFLDLEQKLHVFRFYTAFRVTSPMSWGAWILLLIYPATLLLGIGRLEDTEIRRIGSLAPVRWLRLSSFLHRLRDWSASPMRIHRLENANVVLGIALGGYTGILLSTLGARVLWSSAVLGPLFLVSGFSTGAALVLLFPITHKEHATVRDWDLIAIATELLLLVLFFVGLTTGAGDAGREATSLFFGGRYTAPFWTFVVIVGLAVPLSLELWERRTRARATVLAPALLLFGGLALRWILVAAGQVSIH